MGWKAYRHCKGLRTALVRRDQASFTFGPSLFVAFRILDFEVGPLLLLGLRHMKVAESVRLAARKSWDLLQPPSVTRAQLAPSQNLVHYVYLIFITSLDCYDVGMQPTCFRG
jgi:hypothetical protein